MLKIIRWANKVCGLLQGQGRGEHCRERRGTLYKVWFGEDRAQSVSLLSSDPWAAMATSPFLCHGLEHQAMCHSTEGGGCEPSSVAYSSAGTHLSVFLADPCKGSFPGVCRRCGPRSGGAGLKPIWYFKLSQGRAPGVRWHIGSTRVPGLVARIVSPLSSRARPPC